MRLRDVAIIWTVLATVLFYAAPVLYPIELRERRVPDRDLLNPLDPDLQPGARVGDRPFRPGAVEAANGDWWLLAIPALLYVAILRVGVWKFAREAPRVAEDL